MSGNTAITENEVRVIMSRARGTFPNNTPQDVEFPEGGLPLTPEQNAKGIAYLEKHRTWLSEREMAVLDNADDFRFVAISGSSNPYQPYYGYPVYRLRSKPDVDGRRSFFDYYIEGGEIHFQ